MTDQKKHEDKQELTKKTIIHKIKEHALFLEIAVGTIVILTIITIMIFVNISSRIVIDKAEIYAPTISLAPTTPGVLEKVYVSEGDVVGKRKTVALIGGKPLNTMTGGIITLVENIPGQIISSNNPIIEMIDPKELRVIGHLDEDKGLADVRVGQKVKFSVDAYKSKEYYGTVDEISPSSRQQDIVFSISDKRQIKQFDIKVKFDIDNYPELKNGMSAKMIIYKYN